MKRASYRAAIAWIGCNDSVDDDLSESQCAELITAALVADIFGVADAKVGKDVCRERIKHSKKAS